jgi:hypothetical protein
LWLFGQWQRSGPVMSHFVIIGHIA